MDSDKKNLNYRKLKDEKLQIAVMEWWEKLIKNNAGKAKLRRCATPAEATLYPEMHSIMRILPKWVSVEAVATIAGILAHVKIGGKEMLAKKLGSVKNGRVLYSEMRFRQLLSCKEWNDFYTALRRAVTILNGKVYPLSVVDIILHWDEEYRGAKYREPSKSLKFALSNEYYSQIIK